MFYTIYKITNKIDGKFYIGSHKTKNLDDTYFGSGKYLKRAIEKYGLENFEKEILHVFETSEEMYAKEAEIVNEDFLAFENTYNLKVGGYGGFDYLNSDKFDNPTHKFEHLSKMGKASTGFTGKTHSEESIAKICKGVNQHTCLYGGSFKGKTHSTETKLKMSKSKTGQGIGEKNSQSGTMWITNDVENKKIKKTDLIPEGYRKGRARIMGS